ncbi:cyclic nucleotide-gated ion channel [Aureococcus anophagefferens]|nr:cyclic nucleotide-gated ion channel [Aureococcus anophagefferens]
MPAVVEALGLRNATLLLGVAYWRLSADGGAARSRASTGPCATLVFVCLLLAAKFTNDEARGLPRKFAAILADVEGLEEDVVLAALAQLELIVLETVAYDLSVPDDLATEERRHPAFVVSWLLAMLVHNGAGRRV